MYKHISSPQTKLVEYLKTIYPTQRIEEEWHLENGLRLDIFLPDLGLGIEYHGQQHFKFIPHFHKTRENFARAKARDVKKIELCEELNVVLITFDFQDDIVFDEVVARLSRVEFPHPDYNKYIWDTLNTFANHQKSIRMEQKKKAKAWRQEYREQNQDKINKYKEEKNKRARELRRKRYRDLKNLKE